jgi:hypothetical protein
MATSPTVGNIGVSPNSFNFGTSDNTALLNGLGTGASGASNKNSVQPATTGFGGTEGFVSIPVPAPLTQTIPATSTPATTATTPAASTITLDTANGSTAVQTTTTTKQVVGAANASDDAATNASAKTMLDSVDSLVKSKSGSSYTAPATQQERVNQIAKIANGLSGTEKTAFLEKLGALGKDFGLNFGQPSISISTDKLTTAQKQIQAALYTEWQTGVPFSKNVTSTDKSEEKSTNTDAQTSSPTAASARSQTATPTPDLELHQDTLNLMAKVRSLGYSPEATKAFLDQFAHNGVLTREDFANGPLGNAYVWTSTGGKGQDLIPGKKSSESTAALADEIVKRTKAYDATYPQG